MFNVSHSKHITTHYKLFNALEALADNNAIYKLMFIIKQVKATSDVHTKHEQTTQAKNGLSEGQQS